MTMHGQYGILPSVHFLMSILSKRPMVASQTDGVMLLILYKALAAARNTIGVRCQARQACAGDVL